jgi:hypothetical protein
MDEFTRQKLIAKLEYAQIILAEVYDFACKTDNAEVERAMACADTCIYTALEFFEVSNGEKI